METRFGTPSYIKTGVLRSSSQTAGFSLEKEETTDAAKWGVSLDAKLNGKHDSE